MKCKYCDCELVEGKRFCPNCGREQEEAAEAVAAEETVVNENETVTGETATADMAAQETAAQPEIKEGIKATPGKIALAIAAGVVVLALLVALVLSGIDGKNGNLLFTGTDATGEPSDIAVETEPAETVPPTTPPDGNPEDVTCKGTYSAAEEEIIADANTVVATIGEHELTIGLLQAYYWDGIYAFLQDYGSYASLFGLDFNQSLDTQLCTIGDISMTWQQYFLQYALDNWHSHQAVTLVGAENGYDLNPELLEDLELGHQQMEETAVSYGYENMDEFMYDYMAPGCSYENYKKYLDLYYRGYGYLDQIYMDTVFTAEDVEAYFLENEADYAESGITKDMGDYVDVRHILLTPEGGTTDENGNTVYSDAEWEACRQAAQEILDQWLAGDATEEGFAELANTHSTDPGSNTVGGLYEGVYEGQMVPAFNDWCFDESRAYGDYGLVKTEYGYHIMFFVGSQDIWYVTVESDMINDVVSAVMPAAMEKYPMTVDYSAIKLSVVEFTSG